MTKQKLLKVTLETSVADACNPFGTYHPQLRSTPSWNLVLGNFHRFSNVISIKYSNVLLKCKTQLTEIKISRKGEEKE